VILPERKQSQFFDRLHSARAHGQGQDRFILEKFGAVED
jgi:hypothetical protein